MWTKIRLPQQCVRNDPLNVLNNDPKSQNTEGHKEGLRLAALVVRLQF